MDPGEHLAEAQRLLRRAATHDETELHQAGLPRQAGDWSVERRASDVTAANAHATIALALQQSYLHCEPCTTSPMADLEKRAGREARGLVLYGGTLRCVYHAEQRFSAGPWLDAKYPEGLE